MYIGLKKAKPMGLHFRGPPHAIVVYLCNISKPSAIKRYYQTLADCLITLHISALNHRL